MKTVIMLLSLIIYLNAESVSESIYDNIIIRDIKETNQNLDRLIALTKSDATDEKQRDGFKSLMTSWKRVETLYLAADLDEDLLDMPRYIDIFHQGKEDIYKQLDRILLSSDSLDVELFKNSTKSINALEYLIFKSTQKSLRQKDMILYILEHMGKRLKEIEKFYVEHRELFMKDSQKMNAIIMNALIESSYKLKEWRVGDPAGLSHKYRGNPKESRAEYHISKLSFSAIEAILLAHQAVIGEQSYTNFSAIVRSAGATSELRSIQEHIKKALQLLHLAPASDFGSDEIKRLYEELTKLHNAYYISLIGRLKVTSKILDSDGD